MKDDEHPLGEARLDADPVVGDRQEPRRAFRTASTRTSGTAWERNLIPLLIRFWKTLIIRPLSQLTTGNTLAVTTAPVSSMAVVRLLTAASTHVPRSTATNRSGTRPTREKARRSLMSPCIRLAPSTANSMYWLPRSSSWSWYRCWSSWQKLVTLRSGSCRSWEAT